MFIHSVDINYYTTLLDEFRETKRVRKSKIFGSKNYKNFYLF